MTSTAMAMMALPAASISFVTGIVTSGALFNKLSHIVEYTLNKQFGDDVQITPGNHVIVSISNSQKFYYIQNIALAALVATISILAVKALVITGCVSAFISVPLLIGGVAAPILFSAFNMFLCSKGIYNRKWVKLSNEEVMQRNINVAELDVTLYGVRVYRGFGSAPKYVSGEISDEDIH